MKNECMYVYMFVCMNVSYQLLHRFEPNLPHLIFSILGRILTHLFFESLKIEQKYFLKLDVTNVNRWH